jgi:hypothetical protein
MSFFPKVFLKECKVLNSEVRCVSTAKCRDIQRSNKPASDHCHLLHARVNCVKVLVLAVLFSLNYVLVETSFGDP